MTKKLPLALYALALLPMYLGGIIYASTSQFMPYHAVAVGHDWQSLEPGIQTLILAALHAGGGLILIAAIVMSLILAIPFQQGHKWALNTVPIIGIGCMLIILRAAIYVDINTPAAPPWSVLVIIIAVLITAWIMSLQQHKNS